MSALPHLLALAAALSLARAGAAPLDSGAPGAPTLGATGEDPPSADLPDAPSLGPKARSRGAPAQAVPKEVRSRLSKSQPRLGEPFDWEIELRHAPAESYALPGKLELAPFQVAPQGCRRAAAGEDSLTTCTLRLTLFELGAHDLPTLRLEAATPQGPRVLDVPGPRVEAAGVIDPKAPAEALRLRDPAPAVALLLPTWRPVWAALGLAALVALGWLAWRAWRRRAARAAAPAPPLPPGERFARRLDALEAERLPEAGRVREYFFRLSEAVREYLGALTGVNALDLTTAELTGALRALRDPRVDVEALRGFSEDADLIKFARFPASGSECDAGMRYARELLALSSTSTATSIATPPSNPDAPSVGPQARSRGAPTPTPGRPERRAEGPESRGARRDDPPRGLP